MVMHQADNSKGNYNYNAFTYSKAHFAPHFHANFELIYMLYGTLVLTVGTRTETISKGEIALILPNQVHAMKGDDASLAFVAVFSSQSIIAAVILTTRFLSLIFVGRRFTIIFS